MAAAGEIQGIFFPKNQKYGKASHNKQNNPQKNENRTQDDFVGVEFGFQMHPISVPSQSFRARQPPGLPHAM